MFTAVHGFYTGSCSGKTITFDGCNILNTPYVYSNSNTIAVVGHNLVVKDSVFQGNEGYLGVIYAGWGDVTVSGSRFENNTGSSSGGVYVAFGNREYQGPYKVSVTGSAFIGNTSGGNGGALNLSNTYDSIVVSGNTFTNNRANQYGGAIYSASTAVQGSDNAFSGNSAGSGGPNTYINGVAAAELPYADIADAVFISLDKDDLAVDFDVF